MRSEGLEPLSAWTRPQGPPRPLRNPPPHSAQAALCILSRSQLALTRSKGRNATLDQFATPGRPCFGLRCRARPEAVKPKRGLGVGN